MLRIACDGSCLGNPGPGGWAAIIVDGQGRETILRGGSPNTTNNRMELTAAIRALEANPGGGPAVVLCDSQYVVRGIREWLPGWVRRGWKTAGRKPVRNQDLWKRLNDAVAACPGVRFEWVRGHAGHPENERADALAFAEASRMASTEPADGGSRIPGAPPRSG